MLQRFACDFNKGVEGRSRGRIPPENNREISCRVSLEISSLLEGYVESFPQSLHVPDCSHGVVMPSFVDPRFDQDVRPG